MVIHEVCVIDKNRCEVQLLALLLSTVLGLDFNKTEERKLSWPSVARIEQLPTRFFHGSTYHLFPTKARPAMFLPVNVCSCVYIAGSTTSFQ